MPTLRSTMQEFPLTVNSIFRHGRTVNGDSVVVTLDAPDRKRTTRFAEIAERADRLATGLASLGVKKGDRVGTFCWNTQEHLEAYFAIPGMGAVMHTLNLRLFPDQLAFVINHAKDKVIIVDDSLVPLLAKVLDQIGSVKRFIVVGSGETKPLPKRKVVRYDDLIADSAPATELPDPDERTAMAMCYTTGTTGDPKGVAYSHRSTYLHTFGAMAGLGITERDRILPIVPMFHANAWGLPYIGWLAGSDFVMPGRFLQPEPLCRLVEDEKVTFAGAVPTIWNEVLRHTEQNSTDFSSMRMVVCGGSAVPRALMERFQEKLGVTIIQGWGMTETSPLAALAFTPKDARPGEEFDWRSKTGRVIGGVELRIVDDAGAVLPWDGKSIGEIEVRGPWITARYHDADAPEKFHDGWLRTGDVGTVDPKGYIQITDRAKDVIKSGGEWISSVELENELMAHPDVVESAVVGVPDARWDERPLACVVLRDGATTTPEQLCDFLSSRVAKWWLPERWAFVPEIPKTSVGKFDKKVLRAQHADGKLSVTELAGSEPGSTSR